MDDVTPLVLGLVMVMVMVLVILVGVVTNALSAIVWLRRQVTSKNSSAIYLAATAINDIDHLVSLFTILFLFLPCSSVCLSVTHVDQSKTVQSSITNFSLSAAWKTLISRSIKLFHKFETSHPEQGC